MLTQRASANRIRDRLEKLNTYNSDTAGGTTRVLFTPPELEARKYIKEEMAALGLAVREDAIGNIFGTFVGSRPDLPPVWTGSHIDTVLHAGMFDGMAGVVAGLEAVRMIQASGAPRQRSIEVVVYTSEEPTRFGLGCLGSRALAGELTLEQAYALTDETGKSLPQVLEELGYDLTRFAEIPISEGKVYGAVELHIEQGAVLESLDLPVGIVHTISAPTNFLVTVTGQQRHAGSTPMHLRQDAFLACCEIALELERLAKESASVDTVATVGKVEVLPGSSNVISGHVQFTIDIRDSDYDSKSLLVRDLQQFILQLEAARGVKVSLELINDDLPTRSDEGIVALLEAACQQRQIPYHKMVSGAFHDSMLVGRFAPIAMIFVPSKDGISHSPEEYTDCGDIALGTDILAETLLRLAQQ
ncbi:Zn-dependent hydrolase [Paenibacillus sanguinis]|uniref:Zn-dependent hydrolase n=1 Tax=Paenibacillus sanguinis TaxID=225906 RepID=UPI000372BE83|nr:Zn-dependent hydrolase [Paenibacillus sanguinis]